MGFITKIWASEIFDSRGVPTVQVRCETQTGAVGVANVPSGASTGAREAIELRDCDPKRFSGRGVLKAVKNVNEVICPELLGREVTQQRAIDQHLIKLDGTANKARLGANAILGVSLAAARAAAAERHLPLYQYLGGVTATTLPLPMFNVINGGAHANNTIDFQEFMIVPVGATTFRQAMQMASEVFSSLKMILKQRGYATSVGDEGGFSPNLRSPEAALDMLQEAVKAAGYQLGRQGIMFALDVAASEFYDQQQQVYRYERETKAQRATKPVVRTSRQQQTYLQALAAKYPLISIEDGFDENDQAGFARFMRGISSGGTLQSVGDDLFVTNPALVATGIRKQLANSVLVKVNQIGTLSETIATVRLAQRAG